jgi:tRNA acetyltransferase TAN1
VGDLASAKSFAVSTVRRGRHVFSSMDVNVRVSAILRGASGCPVNLDFRIKLSLLRLLVHMPT